jgi:hypothetical protein
VSRPQEADVVAQLWKRALALGATAGLRAALAMQKPSARRLEYSAAADALECWGGRMPHARFATASELTRRGERLLQRQFGPAPLGQPTGAVPRDVIVVDDFYEDPDAVRAFALRQRYEAYRPGWFSSALEVVDNPLRGRGVRLATPAIRERLSRLVHAEADETSWHSAGDGWNGAFHYKTANRFVRALLPFDSSIHNHVGRDEDVRPGGWSGLVYLNPQPQERSGTSIWMHKPTRRCWALEPTYSVRWRDFELILDVENRYNRLVLFYGSIFHLAAAGWGSRKEDARLFQTFFWNVRPAESAAAGAPAREAG